MFSSLRCVVFKYLVWGSLGSGSGPPGQLGGSQSAGGPGSWIIESLGKCRTHVPVMINPLRNWGRLNKDFDLRISSLDNRNFIIIKLRRKLRILASIIEYCYLEIQADTIT